MNEPTCRPQKQTEERHRKGRQTGALELAAAVAAVAAAGGRVRVRDFAAEDRCMDARGVAAAGMPVTIGVQYPQWHFGPHVSKKASLRLHILCGPGIKR